MKKNQRVVKSIPDKVGNNYTKTANGGKARMQAAANYMDQRESTQLHKYENGLAMATDRYEAGAEIENSDTKYQQHVVFTTELKAISTYTNENEAIKHVAKAIQERRPDAEIYALALHGDGEKNEDGVHVHAIFGTRTTLRRDDLTHFREEAYKLEKKIELDNQRDLSQDELEWIERQRTRKQKQKQERGRAEDEQT